MSCGARALLGALLAAGCSEPAEPPPGASMRAYLVAAATPADPGACAAIPDDDLRAECVTMAARELALSGAALRGMAACRGLPEGVWRDECAFLVVDVSEFDEIEARRGCRDAGRFARQCLGHLIARQAQAVIDASPPGQEAATLAAVEAVVNELQLGGNGDARARGIVARNLAVRDLDQPFGVAHCGDLDRGMCRDIYAARVRVAAGATWQEACAAPLTPEAAEATGIPPWTEDMASVVQEAWAGLCAQPGG